MRSPLRPDQFRAVLRILSRRGGRMAYAAKGLRRLGRAVVIAAVLVPYLAEAASADGSSVQVTPSASGLPGTSTLISLLGGLQFDAMLAAIAGVIIGAAIWALSAHSNNYQGAGKGKATLLASAAAALLIGFGPDLVQSLFNTGAAAK